MASHFDCIGFPLGSDEELLELVNELCRLGRPIATPSGGAAHVWTDPLGPAVYVYLTRDRQIECVTPTFFGSARLQAQSIGPKASEECRYCDGLHVDVISDGAVAYPLYVQIEDVALTRDRLPRQKPVALNVNAFAQQIEAFADEATYSECQKVRAPQPSFAPESVVPTGLFTSSHPGPHMLMTGRILESAVRKNALSGKPYVWARVKTFGGEYDLLASYAEVPDGLSPGQIVQGTFWIVGRVADGLLPPPKPGWISKSTRRIV